MSNFYDEQMGYGYAETGEMYKTPTASTSNIQQFIAMSLGIDVALLEFVKLTEPFADTESAPPHACVFSLVALETYHTSRISFFDKATIDVAYCPHCLKVLYYVEKY